MTEQRTLFDGSDLVTFPKATARADPPTSRQAEQRHTRSGRRETNAAKVLAAVRQHSGDTSRELAEYAGLDRWETARRLSDLRHQRLAGQGPARRCSVAGTIAVTWWAPPL